MKRLALLLLLLLPFAAQATPSCTVSFANAVSASANATVTTKVGDAILVFATDSQSGVTYVNSITDTFTSGLTTSLYGTYNTSGSLYKGGASFGVSAFLGASAGTGSDTVTVTWTVAHSDQAIFVVDCTGVSGTPLVSNIVNYQASVSSGANVITVAGGTGSDSVNNTDLIVTYSGNPSATAAWSAGTTPNAFTKVYPTSGNSAGGVETFIATATATLDSTAGVNGTEAPFSWQVALAPPSGSSCTHNGWTVGGAASVPTSGSTSVWLPGTGAFGTVNCSSTSYYQLPSGALGVN